MQRVYNYKKISVFWLFSIALLILILPSVLALNEFEFDTCIELDSAGAYQLNASITAFTDGCVNITASDVILNGNSFNISGASGTGAYAILVNGTASNVTIYNMIVDSSYYGIGIYNSSNVIVDNTTITNSDYGLNTTYSQYLKINNTYFFSMTLDDVTTTYVNYSNFTNNYLLDSGEDGIDVGFSGFNLIHNNTINTNTGRGIWVHANSPNNVITYNNVSATGSVCIGIDATGLGTNNNVVRYNYGDTCAGGGVYVSTSVTNTTIEHNLMYSSTLDGANLQLFGEYRISNSNSTYLYNNTGGLGVGSCISLFNAHHLNAFNNTCSGLNARFGFMAERSSNVTLQGNTFNYNNLGEVYIGRQSTKAGQNLTNFNLINNSFTNSIQYGVLINVTDNLEISNIYLKDNRFNNNTYNLMVQNGLNLSGTDGISNVTLVGNIFQNGRLGEVYVSNVTTFNVLGNPQIYNTNSDLSDWIISNDSNFNNLGITNITTLYGNYILTNTSDVLVKAMNLTSSGASASGCSGSVALCTLVSIGNYVVNVTNTSSIANINITLPYDKNIVVDTTNINLGNWNSTGWYSFGREAIDTTEGLVTQVYNFASESYSYLTLGIMSQGGVCPDISPAYISYSYKQDGTAQVQTQSTIGNLTSGSSTFFGFSPTIMTLIAVSLLVGIVLIVIKLVRGKSGNNSGFTN